MPNYEDLRTFFDEQEDLREIASRVSEIDIVTGITIDVDPLWALLHDIGTGLVGRKAQPWLDDIEHYLFEWPGYYPGFKEFPLRREDRWFTQYQGYRRRDLYYTDDQWTRIRHFMKAKMGYDLLPVIMTVVHRPIRPPMHKADEETDDQNQLRDLIGIINEARVLVRVEERPAARFAYAAGDEILTHRSKTGILGGVLHDVSGGREYGLTCAHVAAKNDLVDCGSGIFLGQCVEATPLVSLIGTTVCDPVNLPIPNPYPGNGPSVNMLDCSLIELMAAPSSMVQLSGIASAISPGQNVVMESAKHRIACKLGSLTISYTIVEHTKNVQKNFCFRDAVEIVPQPWGPFGGTLGQMTTTMPTQGDSGAWLLTDDAVPIWAGVLFGEDGRRGFAIRASWVHAWAEQILHASLTV